MAVIARPDDASHALREAARSGQVELRRDHRFGGVKVFSATSPDDAEPLGDDAATWIEEHAELELVDITVARSPGCVSIVITYVTR